MHISFNFSITPARAYLKSANIRKMVSVDAFFALEHNVGGKGRDDNSEMTQPVYSFTPLCGIARQSNKRPVILVNRG